MSQLNTAVSSHTSYAHRANSVPLQVFEQPQNALQIGIWKTKVGLYQQALRRLSPQTFLAWPGLLLRIDASIKGLGHENPEHLVLQAISSICGKPLFH